MEFLSTENRSTQEIETLSKIDQTLARSRKVIQESIELTRKSASRRAQFENRVHRSQDYKTEGEVRNTKVEELPVAFLKRQDRAYYQEKIQDLSKQLENQEYIKQGYAKALKEMRDRVSQIQETEEADAIGDLKKQLKDQMQRNQLLYQQQSVLQRNIQELIQENTLLKQKLSTGNFLEENLNLKRENSELKQEIEHFQHEVQALKSRFQSLDNQRLPIEYDYNQFYSLTVSGEKNIQEENQKLKRKINRLKKQTKEYQNNLKTYEHQIQQLQNKIREQFAQNKELQSQMRYMYQNQTSNPYRDFESVMKKNAEKIQQLEHRLKSTTQKYDELEKQIPVSGSQKSLVHKRKYSKIGSPLNKALKKPKSKRISTSMRKSFDKRANKIKKIPSVSSTTPKRRYY